MLKGIVILVILIAITSCSNTPSGQPLQPSGDALDADTVDALQPQLPALPEAPTPQALPDFPGTVPVVPSLQTQAGPTDRVQMRLLVVAASSDDYGLSAWQTLLEQVGIPYETLIASTQPLSSEQLIATNGDGRYQGILLTSNNLAYFDGSSWQSGFSPDEWNLLWQYERDYAVRQVSLYSYPSSWPEDYGISYAGVQDTTGSSYPAQLTTAGWPAFDYLQRQVSIPIRYAYTYLAALDPASTSSNITPILTDNANNILAVTSTSADGRERLALTFANNPFFTHTQLLGYGLIRWVSKGLFLGERSLYFMADVDDYFLPNDMWDPATRSIIPNAYRLTSQDVLAFSQQQQTLRNTYRQARRYETSMAFNGEGADLTAPQSCDPDAPSPDPLTSMTRCLYNSFQWLNHSFSHEYFDFLSYDESRAQIYDNRPVDRGLRLRAPNKVLITGDVSGLGWYNANGDGPKTDYGLDASNPDFLQAAKDLRVTVIASNASVASHVPNCKGCGIYHPLEPSILLVPRWPTNVFYSVTTPEQVVSAYNGVYGPNGSTPYWNHDLSYDEFLNVETDIALHHMLSFSPYPHFFHAANLREYAPGRSILYDYLDRLFQKYSSYYQVSFRSISWNGLATYVQRRTSFMNAEATGVWDRAANTVTLSTPVGGTVYMTGARVGSYTNYGGEPTARFTLAAGGSTTVTVPAVASLALNGTDTSFEGMDEEDEE